MTNKKKTKIVVVGNCQARPIAMALERLNQELEVTAVAIVHLLKNEQFEEYRPHFEEAGHIVAQLVNDNYPCEFVRTRVLKDRYADKVVSIVNLYFTGYTPDWFYIRIPGSGPLRGPMGDYHNKTIVKAWKNAMPAARAADLLEDRRHNLIYSEEKYRSLAELKRREVAAKVTITDFIEAKITEKRLFFTFNHPSAYLVVEYAKRILEAAGIESDSSVYDFGGKEPLSQFRPIANPASGLPNGGEGCPCGVDYEIQSESVSLKARKQYQSSEMVRCFYEIYDHFKNHKGFRNVVDRMTE